MAILFEDSDSYHVTQFEKLGKDEYSLCLVNKFPKIKQDVNDKESIFFNSKLDTVGNLY